LLPATAAALSLESIRLSLVSLLLRLQARDMSAAAIMSSAMSGVTILIPVQVPTQMIITCCDGLTSSAMILIPNKSYPETALQTKSLQPIPLRTKMLLLPCLITMLVPDMIFTIRSNRSGWTTNWLQILNRISSLQATNRLLGLCIRGRTYFCGHDHFYDHARVDDGDGNPNNDIHQFIIGTAGAPPYTWSPPYEGNNTIYTVEQWNHAKGYGYVLVEIDGLNVTMTWIERQSKILNIPGIYEPNEVWSYTVTPKPIVLSPNGGETLSAAGNFTISWKTIEGTITDYVIIEYSLDNGQSWQEIDSSPNTGWYEWNSLPRISSAECLVRISDLNDTLITDTSDNVFSISKCRTQLKADLNGDCNVDILDFAILADYWLK